MVRFHRPVPSSRGCMTNTFIYCANKALKRRINKVYTTRNGDQFIYGYDSEIISLNTLDYMLLPHFVEANIASIHNRQNSLTWWYKKRRKGVKYVR